MRKHMCALLTLVVMCFTVLCAAQAQGTLEEIRVLKPGADRQPGRQRS